MWNERLQKFRKEIGKAGIDGALIYKDANRNYLSGFTGEESYILVTDTDAFFITDSRYTEQAKNEVSGFDIKEYDTNINEYIGSLVKSLGINILGFEENYMTFEMYDNLNNILTECRFVGLNKTIEKLRQIKDESEIKNIEKAASIADKAFSYILGYIKPGMTESNISMELEFFMRSEGATGVSFPTIAASGKRSALPHGKATNKIIEVGDFLTLDFGCVYNGYCSDMTRTIVIGKANEKQKEIYNIVLESNKKALSFIKPGIKGEEADSVARNVIETKGYGDYFKHGLGHGVGMEIHELPHISKKGKDPLQPGMVVTDEPGIYIPDFGGVRIEDLVLLTQEGNKVISKSTKELIEII